MSKFVARLHGRALVIAVAVAVAAAVPAVAELGSSEAGPPPAGFDRDATLRAIADAAPAEDPAPEAASAEFGDLAPDEAQELLEDRFADDLAEPEKPLALPEGTRVERYLGAHTAIVDPAEGRDQVAVSALPLRTRDDDGRLAPVDLGLREEDGALEPANALVDVRIPDTIGDAVEVGDVGVTLAPGVDAEVASELTENKAFFADAAHDADWVVGPVPTGAEALLQLRSAGAGERHVLRFDLPEGATLRASDDGGAEAVRDGDVVARVLPPSATDAQGTPVPVHYEIADSAIALVTEHRSGAFAYPVLVDPVIEDWGSEAASGGWFADPSLDQLGWAFSSSPADVFRGATQGNEIASFGAPPGRGLYIQSPPRKESEYTPGDFGQWHWRAPGSTTTISRAEFRTMYFDRKGASQHKPVVVTGLWSSAAERFTALQVHNGPLTGTNATVVPEEGAGTSDTAVFELRTLAKNVSPKWLTAYLGGAVLYLDDPEAPTVLAVDAAGPGSWVGAGEREIVVRATDPGLGVKSLELAVPGEADPRTRTNPCLGSRLAPCPSEWEQRFTLDASTLPEGATQLAATATDPLGHRSEPRVLAVRVDRSAPTLALSGALFDAAGGWPADAALPLAVHATDAASGVRSVEVLVDGERRDHAEQACDEGACALDRSLTVDTAALGEGRHEIRVVATDVAGNREEETWTVGVDRTDAAVTLAGELAGKDGAWLDGPAALDVAATDAGGSGVRSVEVLVDGLRADHAEQPCADGGCALDRSWTLDPAGLDEGRHLVQVLVLDGAGRLTQRSLAVGVDRAAPGLALSGPLTEVEDSLSEDTALHAAATDAPGSGIANIEVLLDGERKLLREQACADGGCPLEVDWTLPVEGLSDGPHYVRVIATDHAGRTKTEELEVSLRADGTPAAPPIDRSEVTPFVDQTSFLYDGRNPTQTGVAEGTIEERRAAVVRGRVLLRDDQPLAGVKVSVLDHPELGQTTSREDGEIYMAVNGGGPLTFRLEREGFLPVDRQVDVPWQGYAHLEDVTMIEPDERVTAVDVGNPLAPLQVHRASREEDLNGERQTTLMFAQGTDAWMEMPDGSTRPLDELHVRATEYTVGESGPDAMPAPLPPTSAYTYAADFSVDEARTAGAKHVHFSKPVIGYVENFRGAPVGARVPNGYYERTTNQWVPDTDGRVVKVLSEAGGLAAIDVLGSGQAATAAQRTTLGIGDDELRQLAELYEPGQELWRVPTKHFSDWNFSFTLIGAILEPGEWFVKNLRDKICGESGSVIECENQTLGEDLRINGTGRSLHYRSDRVPGRRADRNRLEIPLIDGSVPTGLVGIDLRIEVAGREFEWVGEDRFRPEPNQKHVFEWDGLDAFGRKLQGAQKAKVSVGYVYRVQYDSDPVKVEDQMKGFGIPPRGARWSFFTKTITCTRSGCSGGDSSAGTLRGGEGPPPITVWRDVETTVGGIDARAAGLGGWTLSGHHLYDPVAKTLYRGDGSRQKAESVNRVIDQFAGNYSQGPGTDGGQADESRLFGPEGMDVGPDGSVYIADFYNDTVRRVRPDGVITTVAGIQREYFYQGWQFSGDGGPATSARLASPTDVDVGPDGSLYITDYGNHRVRKVDPDGIITTVAGNGGNPVYINNAPATQTPIYYPQASAVAEDGTLYIGDRAGHVRRVGPDGIMTTYAGGGRNSPNGQPATEAYLYWISDLALASDGTLYIAESSYWSGELHKVTPDGYIDRIAGLKSTYNGEVPTPEDGTNAADAKLDISHVAVGPDDSVHIGDSRNKVWRLLGDGTIYREAGGGPRNSDWQKRGDDGPARLATISSLNGIAIGPDNAMYLSDWGYNTVRRVGDTMPGFTGEDLALPSADGAELYRFDATGRHLSTVGTATGVTRERFGYDAAGRLSCVADAEGSSRVDAGDALDCGDDALDGDVTRIERDAGGAPAAIVAPFGQRTALSVDGDGFLDEARDPAGRATTMTYERDGLLTSFAQPGGRTTTFAYDEGGRLERDTNADGGFKALARTDTRDAYTVELTTKMGRKTTYDVAQLDNNDIRRRVTDPAGITTETLIAPDGRQTVTASNGTKVATTPKPDPTFGMRSPLVDLTVKRPSGAGASVVTERTATLANPDDMLSLTRLEQKTTVGNRTQTSTWTRAERKLTERSPSGRTTARYTDALGRVVREEAPGLAPITYRYDDHGRLEEAKHGSRAWTYAYGEDGRLKSLTDPRGRTVEYERDALGRVREQHLADDRSIAFGYDGAGNLERITPPGRPAHVFGHSATGLKTSWTAPLTPQTGYRYDDDQNPIAVERPDGGEVAVERSATSGRIEAIRHRDGTVDLDYDATSGDLKKVAVPDGQAVEWERDGSVAVAEKATGEVAGEVRQERDGEGRLKKSTVTGSPGIDYAHDVDGMIRTAGALTLTRHATTGLLAKATVGAVDTAYTRDTHGDLEALRATHGTAGLYEEKVERDAAGRIVARIETVGGQTNRFDYGFDGADRLTSVKRDGETLITYRYDDNGNRIEETPAGAATIASTFDDEDRLLTRGDVEYDWSESGELASRTRGGETTRFAYDELGGLRSVERPDGRRIEYVLDGLGRRVGTKVDGELRSGLVYGEAARPSAELAPDGSVRSRFVYGTRATVPDYMVRDGRTYRFVTDRLGSPRLLVDTETGEVAQRLDYDAFGRVLEDTSPGFQPFGYAGGLYDRDTGLVRFGARDYDPETGRWTAKDPIDFAGGDTNLYGYTANDPVNFVDPSGLAADTAVDAAFLAYDVTKLALGCGSLADVALSAGSMLVPGLPNPRLLKLADDKADDLVDLTSPDVRRHILDGEVRPNGSYGGGHRSGTGFPNKSEFPADWSDDEIMHHISDVATDPMSATRQEGGTTFITGTRNGIDIEVVVRNGEIRTGYPTNVPRNP